MSEKNSRVNKNILLITATFASFLVPFMTSSVNIALPTIAQDLSVDAINLSWITTSFLLTSAMFAVPFAKVADIYGMKRIFKYGIIIFVLSSLAAAFSNSVNLILLFRCIQGFGASMLFVTSLAMIVSIFPKNERGKAIGINVSAVYLGLICGPVIGGFLNHFLGWRSIFIFAVIVGLISLLLVITELRDYEWAETTEDSIDYKGSILYMLMLALILLGFSNISEPIGIILLVLGIVLLLVFIYLELRVDSPILEMKLFFNNRCFAFSNLATLISFASMYSVTFLLSLYLQYIKGYTSSNAGLIMCVQTVLMLIISPISGRLSDRYDPGKISSLGMCIISLSTIMLALIDANSSLIYIIVTLAILGIGIGIFSAPNTTAIMSSVERKFYGVASASVSTMRLVGQTSGMAICLLAFSLFIGSNQILPNKYPALITSLRFVFTISFILSIFAIFASLARSDVKE